MKTTVVNIKLHPCDVYIGRGTKWGNRFTHVAITEQMRRKTPNIERVITRAQAIQFYADELKTRHDLLAALPELVGKVLGCSCKPLSCHGDVLAALANGIATCGCYGCEDEIALRHDPVTNLYYHDVKDPIGGRTDQIVCSRIHPPGPCHE